MTQVQNFGKESQEAEQSSPLTGGILASSYSSKYDKKKNSAKKKQALHSSEPAGKKSGPSKSSLEDHNIDRHNKDVKGVNVQRLVQKHFNKSLKLNIYCLNKQS